MVWLEQSGLINEAFVLKGRAVSSAAILISPNPKHQLVNVH